MEATKKEYFDRIAERGQLIVVSGPSGAGKRTVLRQYMAEHPSARRSVSATTREPRPDEQDGVDYFFLSRDDFDRQIRNNEMMEYSYYNYYLYGTPKRAIETGRAEGKNMILEIEVQGAMQVREICPDATLVFIMPPSVEELRRRLEGRGTDAPEVIDRRVAKAEFELTKAPEFDHVVVNDCLDEAVCGTCSILDQFIAR